MEISNLLPITTRKELRIWLENNHLTSSCCWVLTTRKPSPHALLYLDAVEEALCFGWIDSTRKKTASGFLAQRLTPRTRIFYSSFNRIRLFTPISWRFPGYTAMCAWIPFKLKKTSRNCSASAWKNFWRIPVKTGCTENGTTEDGCWKSRRQAPAISLPDEP